MGAGRGRIFETHPRTRPAPLEPTCPAPLEARVAPRRQQRGSRRGVCALPAAEPRRHKAQPSSRTGLREKRRTVTTSRRRREPRQRRDTFVGVFPLELRTGNHPALRLPAPAPSSEQEALGSTGGHCGHRPGRQRASAGGNVPSTPEPGGGAWAGGGGRPAPHCPATGPSSGDSRASCLGRRSGTPFPSPGLWESLRWPVIDSALPAPLL